MAIVTDHNDDTRACLLHIGSPRVDEVQAMTNRLAALPVRVRDCTNVYQGLARLCIADSDKPAALVVSVDVMDAAELEFFRIVARRFPSVPVYVYGGTRACARVDRAIEMGARDRASVEVLTKLGRSRATPPAACESACEIAAPSDGDAEAHPDAPPSQSDCEPIDPPNVSVMEDEDPVVEEEVGTVRVPWLSYKDAPVRRAPDSPAHESPLSQTSEKHVVRVAEPLLSDEELRALLETDDLPMPAPPEESSS